MLKELFLKNFAITESCQIIFEKGFNVLSGETGSGKTMLIEALSLILGQKADPSFIRKGEDKALIKAVFKLDANSSVYTLLQESGIEIESGEDLLISRELSISLKNKIFIQSQQASLPLLKLIGPHLIETISQHSQLLLKDEENHRNFLDDFGDLAEVKKTYQKAFLEEKEIQSSLDKLKATLLEGRLQQNFWKESLEELLNADIKDGEEDKLFEEYKKLINFQEIQTLSHSLFSELSESPYSILSQISKAQKSLTKILSLDSHLSFLEPILNSCHELLSEGSFSICRYLSDLEEDPGKLEVIEKRLTHLKHLSKKYGSTFADIQAFKQRLEEKLQELETLESSIEELTTKLSCISKEKQALAIALTNQRLFHSKKLSKAIEEHLHLLNMSGAKCEIHLKPVTAHLSGADLVSFWLAPNGGDDFQSIKDHASGGELSRVFFALKLILASKDQGLTLIFDEIDANIGGITASIFGKELKHLGLLRQVICITHFPQVASFADHHMQILKSPSEGRMIAEIKVLSESEKKEELIRMLGGSSLLHSTF